MLCGNKVWRIIIIKKVIILITITIVICVIRLLNVKTPLMIGVRSPILMQEQLKMPDIRIIRDPKSSTFLAIVLVVTSVVVTYREIYIEHYRNKKFLAILLGFFFAMILLASRSRTLNVIIGWEALGLRSLLLIIFYPNKTGKYNSLMTIFFNRLGDVILIVILGTIMLKDRGKLEISRIGKEELALAMVCAMTKRAQFPISA